jgi:hypothetical protein
MELLHVGILIGRRFHIPTFSWAICSCHCLECWHSRALTDDGDPVERMDFMFTPTDQQILRQYECAAEPVVLLSKFFQMNVPTAHLILFHLRVRIADMRKKTFSMYGDISHSDVAVLTNRTRTETVLANDVEHRDDVGRVEPMANCIQQFRHTFANDLEHRCGLTHWNDDVPSQLTDVKRLPADIAMAALLNPLLGGENHCVISICFCVNVTHSNTASLLHQSQVKHD